MVTNGSFFSFLALLRRWPRRESALRSVFRLKIICRRWQCDMATVWKNIRKNVIRNNRFLLTFPRSGSRTVVECFNVSIKLVTGNCLESLALQFSVIIPPSKPLVRLVASLGALSSCHHPRAPPRFCVSAEVKSRGRIVLQNVRTRRLCPSLLRLSSFTQAGRTFPNRT